MRHETDHSVLEEVVSRVSWIEHRGVFDTDRPALHSWIRRLFAPAAGELGWDVREGEEDERRLRRAAVLRGLTLVARDPQAVEEAQERFRRLVAPQPRPIDPNLLDVVVAAAARTADRGRFSELRRRAEEELDPAAKRRFLHALAMVERPELVPEAVQLSLTDVVRMQDFPSYMATLEEFNHTIFAAERFKKQVDEIAAAIRSAIEEESNTKVARFDKVVRTWAMSLISPRCSCNLRTLAR